MKNTLSFNLNNFSCDCISIINDGSNSISLEAIKTFTDPQIKFTLNDGSIVTQNLTAENNTIRYTIPESYYNLTGSLLIQFIDGSYSSDFITLVGIENNSGYSLSVTMNSNTNFSCKFTTPAAGGDFNDEWKNIINANTAARHTHANKGALDVIETALTNQELEGLLV